MNDPKDSYRLSVRSVFFWGTGFTLLLVALVFLYVPKAPKDTGTAKSYAVYEGKSVDESDAAVPLGEAQNSGESSEQEVSQNGTQNGSQGVSQEVSAVENSAPGPEDLYLTFCSQCHGKTGNGDSPMSRMMTVKPTNLIEGPYRFERTEEAVATIIRQGVGTMPGFKDEISQEKAVALARYVISLDQTSAEKNNASNNGDDNATQSTEDSTESILE